MRQSRGLRRAVVAAMVLGLATTGVAFGSPPVVPAADPGTAVISRYRERIPELMAQQGIPGLAVALVDRDRALWVEGFGQVDGPDSPQVTGDTIFSVQSMSKLFTATAVMQAVEAGRLDLDEPVTTYLPDFTVHSAFEQHPEREITLRMLLSHTAGLAQEAPHREQQRARPGQLRRPREQHHRHLAALPGRHRIRLLESGHRPRRLHPATSRGEAVPGGHARVAARAARYGPQHLRSIGDSLDRRSGCRGMWFPFLTRRSTSP